MSDRAAQDNASHKAIGRGLTVAALGVVYGDIGTSPLYSMKQCFQTAGSVTELRVFGVLSLIVWALTIVVTIKYVIVLMRADNHGEGGIFALTALALRATTGRSNRWILIAGLVGGSLFLGDGVLTPAISVMSAVEGLEVRNPELRPFVLPLVLALLVLLFMAQRRGTERIGVLFGPLMLMWFSTIGLLGLLEIARNPAIIRALNPLYGLNLIVADPASGFILLGSVVLVVTGAEALYADMGHFGRAPIRRAWLRFVFPCLLLNYFGQGALLLANPNAAQNPFYLLAPEWAAFPLVLLASAATVIASQAVISGAFSLSRQGMQLGYLPRMHVRHTSEREVGQVYVPAINLILLVAVVATVLLFRTSNALGAAYGIAVTGTMAVDTTLAFIYLLRGARWPLWWLGPIFALFATVDLGFLGANLLKLGEGGWFPVAIGGVGITIMTTWMWGRARLAEQRASGALPLAIFLEGLNPVRPERVTGTAVYMTARIENVPTALLHNMKHNQILHERNVIMGVQVLDRPRLTEAERLEIRHYDQNFHTVTIRYGFLEEPDIPRALALCRVGGFHFNLIDTSFFVGRDKIVSNNRSGWTGPFKQLFIFLSHVSLGATEFFRIPVGRVVELGGQVEI
jgi:KUP system potassium uptake protein